MDFNTEFWRGVAVGLAAGPLVSLTTVVVARWAVARYRRYFIRKMAERLYL